MYVVFVFAEQVLHKYQNYRTSLIYYSTNNETPTWGPMNELMRFSYQLLNDSYAAGSAAFAVGGPLLIPFALKWGRRPVYVSSTAA